MHVFLTVSMTFFAPVWTCPNALPSLERELYLLCSSCRSQVCPLLRCATSSCSTTGYTTLGERYLGKDDQIVLLLMSASLASDFGLRSSRNISVINHSVVPILWLLCLHPSQPTLHLPCPLSRPLAIKSPSYSTIQLSDSLKLYHCLYFNRSVISFTLRISTHLKLSFLLKLPFFKWKPYLK